MNLGEFANLILLFINLVLFFATISLENALAKFYKEIFEQDELILKLLQTCMEKDDNIDSHYKEIIRLYERSNHVQVDINN